MTVVRETSLARRNASSSSPMPETAIPIAPMASACLAKSTRTSSPSWRGAGRWVLWEVGAARAARGAGVGQRVVERRDALGPRQPVDHREPAIVADHHD